MKSNSSRKEAESEIKEFFKSSDFSPAELKKIKKLSMRYRISLKTYKKKFCRSCLNPLSGSIKISKEYKAVICKNCQKKNKWKIKK